VPGSCPPDFGGSSYAPQTLARPTLPRRFPGSALPKRLATICAAALVLSAGAVGLSAASASGAVLPATSSSWCSAHGSAFAGWAGSTPQIAICGPGPDYGGTWGDVDLPGPSGLVGAYYNATPGFQCVELAERFLAIADGLAPVHANGSSVAMNYHAAYPDTRLIVNGSLQSIGNEPTAGDVVSFSFVPGFLDPSDGHVAIVVGSHVDVDGNGTVTIAQENVPPSEYRRVLDLVDWRLVDPTSPGNAEYSYPYAEWLIPHPIIRPDSARIRELLSTAGLNEHSPLAQTTALLTTALRQSVKIRAASPARRTTSKQGLGGARVAVADHLALDAMVVQPASHSSGFPIGAVFGVVTALGLAAVAGRRMRRRSADLALRRVRSR
jgi:hypothetical protein